MALIPHDDKAKDVQLEGAGNRAVQLSESWQDRTAVLFFLRHFG